MGKNDHKTTPDPVPWEAYLSSYLKLRKKLHVLSYQDISERLKKQGFEQSRQNLSVKFQSGKLSAALFLSILKAMGDENIELKAISDMKNPLSK